MPPGLVEDVQVVNVDARRGYAANVQVGADGGNLSRERTAAPRATLRGEEDEGEGGGCEEVRERHGRVRRARHG